MIKGIQRKMIVVKTRGSNIFEEAYFLLRTDLADPSYEGDSMLREANRIIAENRCSKDAKLAKGRRRLRAILAPFVCGFICGGSVIALVWLAGVAL